MSLRMSLAAGAPSGVNPEDSALPPKSVPFRLSVPLALAPSSRAASLSLRQLCPTENHAGYSHSKFATRLSKKKPA